MITMPGSDTDLSALALQRSAEDRNRSELNQGDFLTLMMTQFKNQDPFKPMDGAEFFGQMAQVSTVSGIAEMNKSVGRLSESIYASQALQAATMVGRTVLAEGQFGDLTPGTPMPGGLELPAATASATVRVYNSAGALVRELPLGPRSAGFTAFEWDGRDAAGQQAPADTYRFAASMRTGSGEAPVDTYIGARVQSVTLSGDGGNSRISTERGQELLLSQIKAIM